MPVEQKTTINPIQGEPESPLGIQEQILTLWHSLSIEHQATLIKSMLHTVMESAYRVNVQMEIARQWPLQTEHLELTYPLIELTELDMKRAHLDDNKIAQLTPEHRQAMAQTMRSHYIYDLFWPEVRHLAQHALDKLSTKNEKRKEL